MSESARKLAHESAALASWPTLAALQRGEQSARRDAAPVRKSAAIRWLIGAAVAAVFLYFGRLWFAVVVASVGTLAFALALVSPFGAHAVVERLLGKLAQAVGTVMTWLLLAPVFYLFMAPFGLIARRGKRDTLERALEPTRATYWRTREERDAGPNLERPY